MTDDAVELEHISIDEAITLANGGSVLVDVREPWEWDAGHAPQAISLPMSQLEERAGELSKDETLLIICHSGQRSQAVTGALTRSGYHAVNVLGGMTAWKEAGGDVVTSGSDAPRD